MANLTNRLVPSLLVGDIEETINFYKILGFRLTGASDNKKPKWIELRLGEAVFQFFKDPPAGIPDKPIMRGTIYSK